MAESVTFRTPVGRMVAGSITRAKSKDYEERPIIIKSGPNAGKPGMEQFFGLAIPKAGEAHWNQTQWGAIIWNAGMVGFPDGRYKADTFSWKVYDGDSTKVNKAGTRLCDKEGHPGHWVIFFSRTFVAIDNPPPIASTWNRDGSERYDAALIKCGHYLQVLGEVRGNESSGNPGVFMGARMIAWQGFGPEIQQGPDASEVGFGQDPLPPGASSTPIAGMATPSPAAPAAPAPTVAPAPVAVAPAPAFILPPPPPAPAAPAAPPAGPTMTAKAGGTTYAAYRAAGWTDEQLRQNGLMV